MKCLVQGVADDFFVCEIAQKQHDFLCQRGLDLRVVENVDETCQALGSEQLTRLKVGQERPFGRNANKHL